MTGNKKLFLSAVSSEFSSYRRLLANDLKRPSLDVAVQEDFVVTGSSTLEKLDTYIRQCHAVIHLIGKACGGVPEEAAVAVLLTLYPDLGRRLPPLAAHLLHPQPGFSYTQWEAYLALYHRRPLFVYRPADFDLAALHVPRAATFVFSPAEAQAQQEHYQRLSDLGHDRGLFLSEERLSSAVLRDLVEILPRLESGLHVSPTRLRHTAERLIGRDLDLTRLDTAWNNPHRNVVIVRAFGGMGKTSLVATWMAELALKNWRGVECVFDWSFYSQGTREQSSASADTFMAEALRTFGDPDPQLGSPWERGARLARLVGKGRCLLVLDGLEPLQHPPGPMTGRVKDQGIEALLKGLAAQNAGLCVVTSREKVADIQQHYGRTVDDLALTSLTDLAGAALLHYAGARRAGAKEIAADDQELQAASREVRGHGLTLQLLGQYLGLAEDGDIQKRDTVRLADADQEYQNDATRPYGHAFKAMEAYERWFADAGEQGQRQLAILRLLGLFDRPAAKECLDALRAPPVIAGLTEALVGLNPRDWKAAQQRLAEINLLARAAAGSLDCHPLLREYFAKQLRDQNPAAWRAAHQRLYAHLCATTQEGEQPSLEDLQPLYQAVAHGCQAGLQKEALDKAYFARIQRGQEGYSTKKLGAVGSDLGAVACFFESPWSRLSPTLTAADQTWLLNEAAFRLRALGRLTEALEPMRAGLEKGIEQEAWESAATSASNLSELELDLGGVVGAVADAEQAVTYADRSGDAFQRLSKRTTHADALHEAGRRAEAEALCCEAEQMQAESQPAYPLLYALQGFRYCDLLLSAAERGAAQGDGSMPQEELLAACHAVEQRAAQTLKWVEDNRAPLLTIALDHLTLGRAALYAFALAPAASENQQAASANMQAAVTGLRRAGYMDHLPRGLLSRAWLRTLTGPCTGPDSAQSDLDEAWEIAERGPMPLFLADIHLYRARLFGRRTEETKYPWESPEKDLAAARWLIEKHGYWRRKEELEDAEAAAKSGPDATSSLYERKESMPKTIIELDLVGYSTISDNLEQGLDVNSVAQLNQQLQSFIDAGLHAVSATRQQAVMSTTGDGAILVFDSAPAAHRFAEAVHLATAAHNRTRQPPLAKRVFRSGAATGEIVMQARPGGGFEIAGATIARAVRLEAKAQPGALQVDAATYDTLSAEQKARYGAKTRVTGKRDEEFEAFQCVLNPAGPEDAAFFTKPAKNGNAPAASAATALGIWQKKLDFLLTEEAKVSDAEQKFSLQQRVAEARLKIQEHGGQSR